MITTPESAPRPAGRKRSRFARLATWSCWAYAGSLAALWGVLWLGADRWWPATVAMYGPRWVWALPLALFLPAAAFRVRGILLPLLLAGLLVVFPIMRLSLPWRAVFAGGGGEGTPTLRVLSCNIDQTSLDGPAFARLVAEVKPDVVALQGWASRYERPTFGRERGPGHWYVQREDELFLASRHPIEKAARSTDPAFMVGNGSLARFDVRTPAGRVRIFNLHLATPRDGLEAIAGRSRAAPRLLRDNSNLRRRQSLAAAAWANEEGGPLLVVGDFNTPPDSTTYREAWGGLTNAFSFAGAGFGNTHFTRRTAVRIDHVLSGPGWRVRRCQVGPDVGSAHRPIITDLEWQGTD